MTKDITFNSAEVSDLSSLAVDVWRLERKIAKINKLIDVDSCKSIGASISKIKAFLDKKNIETTDLTDQKYDDGLNVDVLSFINEHREIAIISETVEPMVKYNGKIIKKAKIIVTK